MLRESEVTAYVNNFLNQPLPRKITPEILHEAKKDRELIAFGILTGSLTLLLIVIFYHHFGLFFNIKSLIPMWSFALLLFVGIYAGIQGVIATWQEREIFLDILSQGILANAAITSISPNRIKSFPLVKVFKVNFEFVTANGIRTTANVYFSQEYSHLRNRINVWKKEGKKDIRILYNPSNPEQIIVVDMWRRVSFIKAVNYTAANFSNPSRWHDFFASPAPRNLTPEIEECIEKEVKLAKQFGVPFYFAFVAGLGIAFIVFTFLVIIGYTPLLPFVIGYYLGLRMMFNVYKDALTASERYKTILREGILVKGWVYRRHGAKGSPWVAGFGYTTLVTNIDNYQPISREKYSHKQLVNMQSWLERGDRLRVLYLPSSLKDALVVEILESWLD